MGTGLGIDIGLKSDRPTLAVPEVAPTILLLFLLQSSRLHEQRVLECQIFRNETKRVARLTDVSTEHCIKPRSHFQRKGKYQEVSAMHSRKGNPSKY